MAGVAPGSKELLPLGESSVLERVAREAAEAGAREIIVIVSPDKRDLMDAAASFRIAVQAEPNGLAPAVAASGSLEPSLVLLPDTVFFPRSPSSRLASALNRGFDIAIAIERVDESQVSRYGIVEWSPESGRIFRILEKPRPTQTASRWAIAARFALSVRALDYVRRAVDAAGSPLGEIDLPPILSNAAGAGLSALAVPLEADEHRFDCGSPEGYARALERFR